MNEKNILLIDDEPSNIFALAAVLRAKNYSVTGVSGMKDAFTKLKQETFDFILADMMMPGIDGYEGIAVIKSESRLKNIPIIAVTAQAMAGDRERCMAAGADAYISKPVDIDLLLKIFEDLTT